MAISTNSIIHYTDSFDILTSILKEGFRIKYCVERIYMGKSGSSYAAHPMLSFCDIPLSDSKQHFGTYGTYGLGLSKKWAVKNGVNPVLYIDKNSLFANSIYELIKERRSSSNLTDNQKNLILQIKAYAKNYSGHLKRKNINDPDYKFYNEREWRLIPAGEKINNALFSIKGSAYLNNKSKYNDKISDCRFTFDVSDISYIIVEKTTEIPIMTKNIRQIFSNNKTSDELDILFSKICSTQQIISDY